VFEPLPLLLGVFLPAPKSETPETIIKSLPLHQKRLNIFEGLPLLLGSFAS
jgi:hypothetical protein